MIDWQIALLKYAGFALIGFIAGIGHNWLRQSDRKSKLRLKDTSVDSTLKRQAKLTEMLIKHRKYEITPDEFREFEDTILLKKRKKNNVKSSSIRHSKENGPNGGRIEYLPNGDKVEWIKDEENNEFSMILLRGDGQLHDAEEEFFDKIWWNRHQIWKEKIESGEESKPDPAIWKRATAAAKRIEDKYGAENLGWDDFEWGMLNGKLSALRWVLGSEWDFLDT